MKSKYFNAMITMFIIVIAVTTCKKDSEPDPNLQKMTYDNGIGNIGKAGGTIEINDASSLVNGTKIDIPQDALGNITEVEMKLNNSQRPTCDSVCNIIELLPNGLTFSKPVTLNIPFDGISVPKLYYYLPDSNSVEQIPIKEINTSEKYIIAEIDHFSLYFVGADTYGTFNATLYNPSTGMKAVVQLGGAKNGNISLAWIPITSFIAGITSQCYNALDFINYAVPNWGTMPNAVHSHLKVKLIEGGWLFNSTLKTIEYQVRRQGANLSESGVKILQLDPTNNLIYESGNLNSDGREAFFSGKALVFDFGIKPVSGKKYYLELTWYLAMDPTIEFKVTSKYSVNTYDYKDPFTTSNMQTSDPDKNKNLIVDTFEPATNNPPNTPSNPSPAIGATDVSTSPTLSWSCSDPDGNTLAYDVYFGTSSNPTTAIATTQSAASITRSGLSNNTIYYWKIVAKDSKGATTSGPVWNFKTVAAANNPPNAPSNPSPASGATGQSTSLTLSWSCNDPDGDALTYDVYFGTSSNPTNTISTGQTATNISRSGLSNSTTYYWKIVAKDNKGGTNTGSVWSFTTASGQTDQPDLTITDYTYTPVNPASADEITFSAIIKNIGNAVAPASKLEFKVGGESSPPLYDIPSLTVNQTYTATRMLTLSANGYTSNITIDPNNLVAESDESNNSYEITFTVTNATTPVLPTVTTSQATSIHSTSAMIGGDVTSDGGATVTENGVYWGTTANPVSTGAKLPISTGTGAFSTTLTSLTVSTTYYVVAYAVNSIGEALGSELSFTTTSGGQTGTVTDIDGNVYSTVTIGTQVWTKENLKTTKYNDGTAIPLVTDDAGWSSLTTPGYCWYNNNQVTYGTTYGALYNWYTVNTGKLCPTGWHVPTDDEWTTLENYISNDGHSGNEGTALKATNGWDYDGNGTDDYGFSALPGGYRYYGGTFDLIGYYGLWWSATEYHTYAAWGRRMVYGDGGVGRYFDDKRSGISVRCLRD